MAGLQSGGDTGETKAAWERNVLAVLEPAVPFLARCTITAMSRYTVTVLTTIFCLFSLSASAIVFFYPLEIETRESTVWLYVLALKQGINIYDHSRVAFVNMNHGPFDPLFKLFIATLLPSFEPWQVTRCVVFALPCLLLIIAWRVIGRSSREAFMHALYLGSIGYLFLLLAAKDWLFVGRSDATVAVLLVLLAYGSISFSPKTELTTALHGFTLGAIAISGMLTNWRTAPSVASVVVFTLWMYRNVNRASWRSTSVFLISCAMAALGIWSFFLYYLFNFDLSLYHKHFFGFYSAATGMGDVDSSSLIQFGAPYNGSMTSFLLSLFDPIASPDTLKGGPLLLASIVYLLIPEKGQARNKAWLLLSCFSFIFCAIAYYLNYWGGGQWYFIPFLIILWFFFCTNYSQMSQSRLALTGICVLTLVCVNVGTVVFPTLKRAIGMERAYDFMRKLKSLQETNTIVSEDTFFFRTSYQGELIDMGDFVSIVSKRAYYGEAFNKTAKRHFDQLQKQPPDYILTGFTESSEMRELIKDKYVLIGEGPHNLTGNLTADAVGRNSKLFERKDLLSVGSPALGLEQVGLYGVLEIQVVNSRKYSNPFNFAEIELQATFTGPSGKKINFFGFYDGDGNGRQTGNVWKLRFMPDELGTWRYTYTWTDKGPGGSGTFTVVDTGLPGPLKVATDNPWYFMTSRGQPFHARPYGMQDYGPRIKSSSGWESNSQQYIDVLKTKVVARGYNMIMASGPDRSKEGRSYWWQNQQDIFDIAVWREYEKVLRYALDNQIYFFPFDGMAEQSAFGMPVSRFTKYLGKLIPSLDRPFGRVNPVFKRYMVARYGAFASFMGYSPTWEWPEFWSESAANDFMSEIRNWNPFPTLLTAHDSSRSTFTGWMGFSMRQASGKPDNIFSGNCRRCGHHGGVQPPFDNMPILASEDIWEAPPQEPDYPQNAMEVRRGAWGIMMAGVIPVYSEWLWDFFKGNGQGEPEVHRMFDFFYSKTRYRQYQQLNQLVSKAARQIASGIPGQEYLVYDEDGGSLNIDFSGVPSETTFSVLWFDPTSGVEKSGGSITGGNFKNLTAPFSGDTVLLLRRVSSDSVSG